MNKMFLKMASVLMTFILLGNISAMDRTNVDPANNGTSKDDIFDIEKLIQHVRKNEGLRKTDESAIREEAKRFSSIVDEIYADLQLTPAQMRGRTPAQIRIDIAANLRALADANPSKDIQLLKVPARDMFPILFAAELEITAARVTVQDGYAILAKAVLQCKGQPQTKTNIKAQAQNIKDIAKSLVMQLQVKPEDMGKKTMDEVYKEAAQLVAKTLVAGMSDQKAKQYLTKTVHTNLQPSSQLFRQPQSPAPLLSYCAILNGTDFDDPAKICLAFAKSYFLNDPSHPQEEVNDLAKKLLENAKNIIARNRRTIDKLSTYSIEDLYQDIANQIVQEMRTGKSVETAAKEVQSQYPMVLQSTLQKELEKKAASIDAAASDPAYQMLARNLMAESQESCIDAGRYAQQIKRHAISLVEELRIYPHVYGRKTLEEIYEDLARRITQVAQIEKVDFAQATALVKEPLQRYLLYKESELNLGFTREQMHEERWEIAKKQEPEQEIDTQVPATTSASAFVAEMPISSPASQSAVTASDQKPSETFLAAQKIIRSLQLLPGHLQVSNDADMCRQVEAHIKANVKKGFSVEQAAALFKDDLLITLTRRDAPVANLTVHAWAIVKEFNLPESNLESIFKRLQSLMRTKKLADAIATIKQEEAMLREQKVPNSPTPAAAMASEPIQKKQEPPNSISPGLPNGSQGSAKSICTPVKSFLFAKPRITVGLLAVGVIGLYWWFGYKKRPAERKA